MYPSRYLVCTGVPWHTLPGTLTYLSVRKCKDHLYIHILIEISFTFPDIRTQTLLGIALWQAVCISAGEATATNDAGSDPPTGSNRSPAGTHAISSPQQLGQQNQRSLHQHRDLSCDEPPRQKKGAYPLPSPPNPSLATSTGIAIASVIVT